jgi:hypothetical protein
MKRKIKPLKFIKIGYQRVDVHNVARLDREHEGCYDGRRHLIYVVENSHVEEANTLLHECLHAIWKTQGIKEWIDKEDEEPIVNAIANGLTQMFRDNPQLFTWLKEKLNA